MLLGAKSIGKRFNGVIALRDVSFTLERGEILGIVGGNGSGKSTLLNIMSRTFDPDIGGVEFEDRDLLSLSASEAAREGIVRIWQTLHPFKGITAFDHVALGLWQKERRLFLRSGDANTIKGTLDDLGLVEQASTLVERLPYFDRRKVDFARCIVAQPKILLADELTSGLTDEETGFFVQRMHRLRSSGLSMLVVEHNWKFIRRVADRVLVMNSGEVEYMGSLSGYFGE